MTEEPRHQVLREMLGAYALGHLAAHEAEQVRGHLDGCLDCRADLAEVMPVARRLGAVDPAALLADPPLPPPDLGDRIARAAARERAGDELAVRRTPRWGSRGPVLVAAAAVVVALLVGGAVGGWIGRSTAPEPAAVPLEPISLDVRRGVTVESADLVDHTWGVELRVTATGFAEGEVFHAAFRTSDGELAPAGEFLGVGDDPMLCFLQSSVMREDVTEVVVTDDRGRTVLSSSLEGEPATAASALPGHR